MIPSTTAETILVVDDDRPLRELIEVILARAGYRVFTAARGAEALRLAREIGEIHLLLADLELAGMDGADLAARFAESHPAAPVLFVSDYVLRIDTTEPFEFLAKPFTTEQLRSAVRRALRMAEKCCIA